MNNSIAWALGLIYVVSEIGLALEKRAKGGPIGLSGTLRTLVL